MADQARLSYLKKNPDYASNTDATIATRDSERGISKSRKARVDTTATDVLNELTKSVREQARLQRDLEAAARRVKELEQKCRDNLNKEDKLREEVNRLTLESQNLLARGRQFQSGSLWKSKIIVGLIGIIAVLLFALLKAYRLI